MANTWGSLKWGEGNFGEQSNVTVPVTGIGGNPVAWNSGAFGSASFGGTSNSIPLSLSEESVTVEVNQGWGRLAFGEENWGETGNAVPISGNALSTSITHPDDAWGELGWSAYNTTWGGQASVDVAINQEINLSSQQLNISQASLGINIAVEAFPSGFGLAIAEGIVDPAPDAMVTGSQLNLGLGSLTVYNEQGWGRDRWGTEVWGAEGIWASVQLDNTNLGLGVASGVQETWGQDEWGASTTEWGGTSITDVDISVTVELNTIYDPGWGYVAWGNQTWGESTEDMALAMPQPGNVDPEPDVSITGNQINIALGEETITASANVSLTSLPLEIAQGQAELDALTPVNVTGQRLNISLNSIVAGASAEVFPTGNQLTITSGSINVQSWQIVDTGTNVNWNIIDTAA